jgi:hypothetical protein
MVQIERKRVKIDSVKWTALIGFRTPFLSLALTQLHIMSYGTSLQNQNQPHINSDDLSIIAAASYHIFMS